MSYQTAQDEGELLETQTAAITTPNHNFAKVALAGTISFILIFALASYHSIYQGNVVSSDITNLAALTGRNYIKYTKQDDSEYLFYINILLVLY